MRAFLGISPPPEVKLAIQAWRDKSLPPFAAPVPAANFHLTLAFLGNISTSQQEQLALKLDELGDLPSFNINLNNQGYWPKPKAFFLGCDTTEQAHVNLVKKINSITNTIGLSLPKQTYQAHLTLARKCKDNPPSALLEPSFSWRARDFHLFESVSGPSGVSYPIRQSWSLRPF